MKKTLIAALALSFTAVLAQAQAPAADNKPQSIQTIETGWQTICRSNAKDRTKMDCSVVHETLTANDRLRIAAVEIGKGEKGRLMVLTLPMGVSLRDGAEVTTDGANKLQAAYSGCQNNGCVATIDLADKALDTIKKGKTLSVSFSDAGGNKIKADVPLIGFTAAIAKAE